MSGGGPRVLLLDIETAPSVAYIWGLWQETRSTEMIASDWYVLCWCAKWLGESEMYYACLPDYDTYADEPANDRLLMEEMWKLLDEADIVIGHNARRFDCKKINARLITHGLLPPSPYRIVDTLQIARSQFGFISNKLDDLGKTLRLGKKRATGGFELWRDVLAGDMDAWGKMRSYCAQDVRLLERIYMALRPWAPNLPNHGVWAGGERVCSKCGSKRLRSRGWKRTQAGSYRRFRCKDCGGYTAERRAETTAALGAG